MAHPGGAPSQYKPEYCKQAEKLCQLGATDRDLAEFFGVSDRTIYRWQGEYPEFCQALKTGKSEADERVERSLYHRAVGFSHEAVKIFLDKDTKEPIYAPYTENVPPDTTACIFWLKNRRPKQWRDVQKHEYGAAGEFDEKTDDELVREIESVTGGPGARSKGGKRTLPTSHPKTVQ